MDLEPNKSCFVRKFNFHSVMKGLWGNMRKMLNLCVSVPLLKFSLNFATSESKYSSNCIVNSRKIGLNKFYFTRLVQFSSNVDNYLSLLSVKAM